MHVSGGPVPNPLPITAGDAWERPTKASEAFARELVADLVADSMSTGERLPTEAAMVEHYGYSRESVREGLRLLEVAGLVTLHRGGRGGPRIGRVDPGNFGRMSTLFLHLAGASYDELFEALVVAECMLAERAALNPDRELVERTVRPLLERSDHGGPSLGDFVKEHAKFHTLLADLADNRVLSLFLQAIGQIVIHQVLRGSDPRTDYISIETDHAAIAEAVLAGDPEEARWSMEQHERRLIGDFRANLGDRLTGFIAWT